MEQTKQNRRNTSDETHQTQNNRRNPSDAKHQTKPIRHKTSDETHQTQIIRRNPSDANQTPQISTIQNFLSFLFFPISKLNYSNILHYQNLQNKTYSHRKEEISNISKLYNNKIIKKLIVQENPKAPKTPPNDFQQLKISKNNTTLKDFTQTTSPKTSIVTSPRYPHKETSIPTLIHHKSNMHLQQTPISPP